jgi:valyl-tRNA synthetase
MAGVAFHLQTDGQTRPPGAASGVLHGLEFYIPLADLIDLDVEIDRLTKERERIAVELDKVAERLGNAQFIQRAPAEVVEREHHKKQRYEDMILRLERNLHMLRQSEDADER